MNMMENSNMYSQKMIQSNKKLNQNYRELVNISIPKDNPYLKGQVTKFLEELTH